MSVVFLNSSAHSVPNNPIDKPSGLGTDPCLFVALVGWFYQFGTPSMSDGFSLVATVEDGFSAGDKSCSALFVKAVSNPATEPADYDFSVTSGGDWSGQIQAFSGVNLSDPVADFTSTTKAGGSDFPTVPAATVSRPGSGAVIVANNWNFNAWVANVPASWNQVLGGGGAELGTYYIEGVSPPSIGATFPDTAERYAIILATLNPIVGGAGLMLGSPTLIR